MVQSTEGRVRPGNIAIPEPTGVSTPNGHIDRAVADVAGRRDAWAQLSVVGRIELLDRMIADTARLASRWVEAECERKGIAFDAPIAGEEWFLGPAFVLRNLQLLRATLQDIDRYGRPRLPGPVGPGPSGPVVARIFPASVYDRLFLMGVTAEVWMPPGVTAEEVTATVGGIYRAEPHRGRVCAVLGAGNVSSIPPNDVLYKLFAEDQVVVLKLNPITDHLAGIYAESMGALIDAGFLRIVCGGAVEAGQLIGNPAVDTVHMTGSDKTFDAVVFGAGEEGRRRKAEDRPVLGKPVTAELGNVTPTIIVPGPWSPADLAYHAAGTATMFAHGGGYECINTRLLVFDRAWDARHDLVEALRATLRGLPNRAAFYPGARARWEAFVQAHPEAERIGAGAPGSLPWTLIPDVEAGRDDIMFTTDPFTCVLSCTAIDAATPADFVDRAVALCNDEVWGTLGVALMVHPDSQRDPATAAALRRAVAELRYGTVAVNTGPALGVAMASPPWGAFPGHPRHDIRSGCGVVHNTYLFTEPQKTVIRAPFRPFPPRPPWLVTHRRQDRVLSRVTFFDAAPSPVKLPAILWHSLRG